MVSDPPLSSHLEGGGGGEIQSQEICRLKDKLHLSANQLLGLGTLGVNLRIALLVWTKGRGERVTSVLLLSGPLQVC